MMKARKISVAMKGTLPSTMKMMNVMIPSMREVKCRTSVGFSVKEHVFGEVVGPELMLGESRCSSGEDSSSESS
jgi:hypothetical protein